MSNCCLQLRHLPLPLRFPLLTQADWPQISKSWERRLVASTYQPLATRHSWQQMPIIPKAVIEFAYEQIAWQKQHI